MKLKTVMFRDYVQLKPGSSEKLWQLPQGNQVVDLDWDEKTATLTVTPQRLPPFQVPAEMIRQRWPLEPQPEALSRTPKTRSRTAEPGAEA